MNNLTIVTTVLIYYNSTESLYLFMSAESGMYKLDIYETDKKLYTMLANRRTINDMYLTGLWTYIGLL